MEMVRRGRVVVMSENTSQPHSLSDTGQEGGGGLVRRWFSRENLIALGVCLLVILLIIVTTDSAPQWIYQGF